MVEVASYARIWCYVQMRIKSAMVYSDMLAAMVLAKKYDNQKDKCALELSEYF